MFKKEAGVVRALLDAGADPRAGSPSAADTARMFGNTEFLAWFDEAAPRPPDSPRDAQHEHRDH